MDDVLEILKEIGIYSEEQLNAAIKKMGGFDVTLFCKVVEEGR